MSETGTNRLSALIECVGRCQGISGPVTNTAELALRPHTDERPRQTPTASIMAAFSAIWPLGHMNGLKVKCRSLPRFISDVHPATSEKHGLADASWGPALQHARLSPWATAA
jgi:hypothetical protein